MTFLEILKDIYYAEKHILKSLPAMIKKANGGELKDALETHRKETEGQIQRLEGVFRFGRGHHPDWVVYAKEPFGGPEEVLRYLSRYTHRAAISNRRLIAARLR
jgi:phosphatidylserine/phosphatidylglycerophosphate/cardiolipin synthase-like enzyme